MCHIAAANWTWEAQGRVGPAGISWEPSLTGELLYPPLPLTARPLKTGWLEDDPFLLGNPIFRSYVSFRQGMREHTPRRLELIKTLLGCFTVIEQEYEFEYLNTVGVKRP